MPIQKFYSLSFSPTGGTARVAGIIAQGIASSLGLAPRFCDLTLPQSRAREYSFGPEDLVLLALPVYAGRLPNKLLPFLATLHGQGTPAVAVTVYGNRHYNEALRELLLLLEAQGFCPLGGAAAVSRHAFSHTLAADRPDAEDTAALGAFATRVAQRARLPFSPLTYDRTSPLAPYYTPLRQDGTPARFLKAKPLTNPAKCTRCGLCAARCPMGSISSEDPAEVPGPCIKCQACIRACPAGAKYFADPDFLSHVAMLEATCTARRPCFFLTE